MSASIDPYSSAELFELSATVWYQELVFCVAIPVGYFPLLFNKGRTWNRLSEGNGAFLKLKEKNLRFLKTTPKYLYFYANVVSQYVRFGP